MKNVRADARCTMSWRWCRSAAGRRGGRRRRRRSCSRCLEPSNHRYSQCCSRRVCTALTLKLRRVAQLCGVARLASSRRGAARWRRLARLQARARSPPSSGRWGGRTPVLQKARGRCAPSLPLTQPTASPLASLPPLLWRLFSLPRLPSARTSQPSPLTTLLSPLSLTIHLSLAAVCRRRHHRCNRHRAVTTSPAAVCHRHPCRPTSSVASLPPSPPPPHHHHPCHRRCLVRRRRRCRPRLHRLTPPRPPPTLPLPRPPREQLQASPPPPPISRRRLTPQPCLSPPLQSPRPSSHVDIGRQRHTPALHQPYINLATESKMNVINQATSYIYIYSCGITQVKIRMETTISNVKRPW